MSIIKTLLGAPQAFALDISDTDIQMLEVKGIKNGTVRAFARTDIADGIVKDGLILDQAKLAEAIRAAVDACRPNKPSTKKVVACLPDTKTVTHLFEFDTVSDKILRETVRQMATQTVPFNLEEMVWDFAVRSRTGERTSVMFAAAKKDLVQAYEHTCALAGLGLSILEPESLSLSRAVVDRIKLKPNELISVIDIGGRSAIIAFIGRLGMRLTVDSPIAGRALTEAIANANKIDAAAAEKLKREKGFRDATAAEAMRDAMKPLIEEFHRAKNHLLRRNDVTLTRVFIAGGSSAMPGIVEELKTSLESETALAVPPFTISGFSPNQLAVVCGLAIRAKKLSTGINLTHV